MARRRSDNPMTILVLGILSIAFFGVILVYFSRKTPILQLKPHVEKAFQLTDVKTRFVPSLGAGLPHIVIELPAGTPADPAKLLEVARFSLKRYVEIAKRTRVDRCTVRVLEGGPELTLRLDLLHRLEMTEQAVDPLQSRASELGLQEAKVAIDGFSNTGTRVLVRGGSRNKATATRLADRLVKLIAKQPYAGEVVVEIKTPEGAVKRRGGRDVPRPKKRRRRKRPIRKKTPAKTPATKTPAKTAGEKTAPVDGDS